MSCFFMYISMIKNAKVQSKKKNNNIKNTQIAMPQGLKQRQKIFDILIY